MAKKPYGVTITVAQGHSPTLVSLRMIETTIRENNGELTRAYLWEALPRKMMYQTFKRAMDYFIEKKQVIIMDAKVCWIDYPETAKTLMAKTKPIE